MVIFVTLEGIYNLWGCPKNGGETHFDGANGQIRTNNAILGHRIFRRTRSNPSSIWVHVRFYMPSKNSLVHCWICHMNQK